VGFIASFLIEKDEDRSVRANALPYPVIAGALIGVAVFVAVDVLSRYGLQIFGVSVAILIMIIAVRKSSKSADNLAKKKMKETEIQLKKGGVI
jgi:peptidoglycan/LPS O-acetylase OafA/YrhL